MAKVDQRHFPGTLHKLIVVNAPWLFQQVYGLVSSWLAPETAALFHVLGDPLVEDSVRKELLLDIDEANLPRRYGGTSTIGLPRLHWRLRQGSGTRIDGEKELVVSSGETVTVTVPQNAAAHAAAAAPYVYSVTTNENRRITAKHPTLRGSATAPCL
jgi:hypothetical protein